MIDTTTNATFGPEADHARNACAGDLAVLLQRSRARTLALADAYCQGLGPGLAVPYSPELNPPLWELGHIGWFQEFWIARNPQRHLGTQADPHCKRSAPIQNGADALYDSSQVPHATRWHLPLPDLAATKTTLALGLHRTLLSLQDSAPDDAALYFYRLALFHEDMHAEAAVYMAQALGVALPHDLQAPGGPRPPPEAWLTGPRPCRIAAGSWRLGAPASGFVFDNELGDHTVELPAYEIDDRPVSWRQYLALPSNLPRYLRRNKTSSGEPVWEHCVFGQWQKLDLDTPACHLSYAEVQAWCQWAGRQLPTEAQWEKAALTRPDFQWGSVWEWTASTFMAYPGFTPHPYLDYSAPWFGSRPALRGASHATAPRMVHPRYRNYFPPERTDIYAGFRTCVAV